MTKQNLCIKDNKKNIVMETSDGFLPEHVIVNFIIKMR